MQKDNSIFFKFENGGKNNSPGKEFSQCVVCGEKIIGKECQKCKTKYRPRSLEAHVPGYARKKDIYEKK